MTKEAKVVLFYFEDVIMSTVIWSEKYLRWIFECETEIDLTTLHPCSMGCHLSACFCTLEVEAPYFVQTLYILPTSAIQIIKATIPSLEVVVVIHERKAVVS